MTEHSYLKLWQSSRNALISAEAEIRRLESCGRPHTDHRYGVMRDSHYGNQAANHKADIAFYSIESGREAAGWSAAHGSVRSRAMGVARVDGRLTGAGLVLSPGRVGQRFSRPAVNVITEGDRPYDRQRSDQVNVV